MLGNNNTSSTSISTGTMIRFALIALGIFLVWFLRDLVLVIFTSIVIASFVESSIPYFRKIKVGRVFAVIIVYVTGVFLLAGLFYLFAPLLITEIYNFSTFLSSYVPDNLFLNYFQNEAFSGAKEIISNLSSNLSLATLLATSKAFIANLSGGFFQTISIAFGSIFNFGLMIILSFYFSVQEKGIENFLRIIIPIKHEEYIVDLWQRSRRKIALWLKGQMLLGIIITVLTYLVLSLLGNQYALLLAIIAGVMEIVPYGTLIALVPAISFTYLSGGLTDALLVAGAYFIIHQFEVFLFAPLVIKKVVGLSPIVVILAAVIGFKLGGIWGLVLAIPVAVILMEIISDVEKQKASSRIKNE
ncbi:MAG: AI-2E family transporter [Patescibacteria group bacterium]